MKYKERRAKLGKSEKAIDEELLYDTDENYPDKYGRSRAQNSEQIKFLEINSERVAQIPKSFLKFCEQAEIEPPKESEYLRYI